SDILAAVRARLHGDAAPLSHLSGRFGFLAGVACAVNRRRVDTRGRFADSLDLSGLVDALWPHRRSEPLASTRSRVADHFATADAEFLRDANCDHRGL